MTLRHDTSSGQGPAGHAAADPVDAFFDQRAEGDAAARLAAALRSDVRTADDFARTQRMVSMFKEPLEGPDLTDAILRRLDDRRGFGARLRRPGIDGRLAACIGLALGATALWVVERNTQPPPVPARVPAATVASAVRGTGTLPAPELPANPHPQALHGRTGLSIGETSIRPLAHGGGTLLLPAGAGNTSLAGLREDQRLAWDASRIEWGATRDSLLAIPALGPGAAGESSLIKVPAGPRPGASNR